MGMTINYTLNATGGVQDIRQLIERLHRRALDLPFEKVGDILSLSGEACDFEKCEPNSPNRWLLIQARKVFEIGQYTYAIKPSRLIAFSARPGEGSEPANVGLCQYPSTMKDHRGKKIRTGLTGWSWWSFCKTQYASNPNLGGIESFLRCHLSVIRLLDFAKELGIVQDVSDEGGYWDKRDVKALVTEVAEWNEMLACAVGRMKDLTGGTDVHSEITKFPDFEHLEAKGRETENEDQPG